MNFAYTPEQEALRQEVRNFIAKDEFPYTAFTGLTYDSGDHLLAAEKAAGLADYAGVRARQKAQKQLLAELGVGDRIMTAGGIFGTVSSMDADSGRVIVELAPGVRVEMLRAAVRERIVDVGEADARP